MSSAMASDTYFSAIMDNSDQRFLGAGFFAKGNPEFNSKITLHFYKEIFFEYATGRIGLRYVDGELSKE